jgi:Flp pilus assembly pilin Flp
MKNIVRRFAGDEKGQAMVLAVILLLVGVLIATGLLTHMGAGLLAGEVYEKRTAELYAADAGVEDAVWKIQNKDGYLPCSPSSPDKNYTITDADGKVAKVNGKNVEVTIEYVNSETDSITCKITSIAATADDSGTAAIDSSTTIEAYLSVLYQSMDLSDILDHVIVSREDYRLQGPTEVEPAEGEEHGPVRYYEGYWPTRTELSGWYWEDVKDAPYNFGTLDVKDYYSSGIGPLFRDGTLTIKNTGAAGLTLPLNGTVYITGDTLIGQTNHAFTIDLNGNTIFVESTTIGGLGPGGPYALEIGTKCTITGSGCIIAVGDIEFMPNLEFSEDDYVLVLSVEGQTYMKPNGDFYGTLAGASEVYIQNGQAQWTDWEGKDLHFPGVGDGDELTQIVGTSIISWELSQQ